MGEERWRIIGVHARKEELERILGDLERWAEEKEEEVGWEEILMQGQEQRVGMEVGKVHN